MRSPLSTLPAGIRSRRFRNAAESARGISPRAAHRSGRDTLASSGSCHRTKAAASRRELELLLLPVGSLPTSVTCPLRSTGITPLPRYYGAVRPYPPHRYFRPHSFRCLYLFPWHRRTGSQVPYESPNESHASYTPGTAWPVGRFPPHSSWSSSATPVLMPPKAFRCVTRGSLTLISLIHT